VRVDPWLGLRFNLAMKQKLALVRGLEVDGAKTSRTTSALLSIRLGQSDARAPHVDFTLALPTL